MRLMWSVLARVLLSLGAVSAGVIGLGRAFPGGEIAFTMNERMYVVDVNSGIVYPIATRNNAAARTLGWSPDGSALLFYMEDGTSTRRIYTVDGRAGHVQALIDSPRTIPDVVWSPDGERIAFSDGTSLFVASFANPHQAETLRTFESVLIRVLAWSPDGGEIAIFGSSGLGSYRIYLVDAQSGRLRPHVRGEGYAWSPDGRQVVYDNASQISLLDVATERAHVIADGYSPSWSPDGEWIALARLMDAHYLILRHVRSGQERALIRSEELIGALDWRP